LHIIACRFEPFFATSGTFSLLRKPVEDAQLIDSLRTPRRRRL
jgi:hypothetical protein